MVRDKNAKYFERKWDFDCGKQDSPKCGHMMRDIVPVCWEYQCTGSLPLPSFALHLVKLRYEKLFLFCKTMAIKLA